MFYLFYRVMLVKDYNFFYRVMLVKDKQGYNTIIYTMLRLSFAVVLQVLLLASLQQYAIICRLIYFCYCGLSTKFFFFKISNVRWYILDSLVNCIEFDWLEQYLKLQP